MHRILVDILPIPIDIILFKKIMIKLDLAKEWERKEGKMNAKSLSSPIVLNKNRMNSIENYEKTN